MAHFFNETPRVIPQTAPKNAAVFTCLYDSINYQPGAILHCDTAASALTGLSRQKILSCTFMDFCHDFPLLNSGEFDKVIHFRSEMILLAGPSILCDFTVTTLFSADTILLNITVQPVSMDLKQSTMSIDVFSNKLDTLDILSHGISHGINNSINLITLSSDLLREIFDDLLSRFDPQTVSIIRGMDITELSRLFQDLMNNIYNSSSKINTTSQAFVHYLRVNDRITPVSSYDVRKVLQSAVVLTEHEIHKSSNEFIYEPPQGIIKRTGNQQEILQALLNCILFLCKYSENKKGSFKISTVIRPDQNNFCILIRHEGCVLSEDDIKTLSLPNNDTFYQLSVAKELISANNGEFEISQIRTGGTEIIVTFTTVNTFY